MRTAEESSIFNPTNIAKTTIMRQLPLLVVGFLFSVSAFAQSTISGTRTTAFEYDGSTGFLTAEIIEPDGSSADNCVRTVHHYDAYGNKDKSTVSNCTGAAGWALFLTRQSTSTYGSFDVSVPNAAGAAVVVTVPAGTFLRTSSVLVTDDNDAATSPAFSQRPAGLQLQTETRTFDPRFGILTQLVGPNGQTTSWKVDDFGRKTRETRIDGTFTEFQYCILPRADVDLSTNTEGCATSMPVDAPGEAVQYVQSQDRDTTGAVMGPFSRTYTDRLGRGIRTVTQSFDGNGQSSGLIYVDVVYNEYGAKVVETQPYFAGSLSSTISNAAPFGRTQTQYDVLGRPVIVDVADPAGNVDMPYIADSVLNGRVSNVAGMRAARSTITYSGSTVTRTNALAHTYQEEKTPNGKLARTTDSLGAQVVYRYDAYGNLIETRDGLGAGNRTAAEFDVRGRRIKLSDPNAGEWRYVYDALGELRWQQSPNQRSIGPSIGSEIKYDTLGRVWQKSAQEFTSTWVFDRYRDGTTCNKCVGKQTESFTSHGVERRYIFDAIGRPLQVRTTMGAGLNGGTSRVYVASQSYDPTKGWVSTTTYPTGVAVKYDYSPLGYLQRMANNANNATLWQAQQVNAWGKLERQLYGNSVQTRTEYQSVTGRVFGIDAGVGTATDVFSHDYAWDAVGNLTSRVDGNGPANGSGAVTETYKYDGINRLYEYTVMHPSISGGARTVMVAYNASGNILTKSDVGAYRYNENGAARPNALLELHPLGGGTVAYAYDANGNLINTSSVGTSANTQAKYSAIAYTSFNLPDSNQVSGGLLGANGARYAWQYDESLGRIKETKISSAGTRTTWYLHPDRAGGLSFEQEIAENSVVTNRHFLSAGGGVIGVLITNGEHTVAGASNIVRTEYWHRDHLGSTAAITDAAGAVQSRYAYDPWGKRRMTDGNYDANGVLIVDATANNTDRGFTGHEHLDDVGIIHMNGRLYDPNTGRFLQTDPVVQDTANLQAFNRYAYVQNNPLNATDPTGMFLDPVSIFVAISIATISNGVAEVMNCPSCGTIASLAMTFTAGMPPVEGGGWEGLQNAAISGFFVSAATSGGNLKATLKGTATAVAFYGAGELSDKFGASGQPGAQAYFENDGLGRALMHAAAGCASASISGADCGRGALNSGFTKYIASNVLGARENDEFSAKRAAVYAAVGGTLAAIGGGKFANGAVTGTFQYLFNEYRMSSAARDRFRKTGAGLFGLGGAIFASGCTGTTGACILFAGGIVTASATVGAVVGDGAASATELVVNVFNSIAEEADNAGDTKPPLSDYKDALGKVHDIVGKLPKGKDGKYGSPQAGDSKKGYRLDPPHDGAAEGGDESKYHFNWWDYTGGKRGKGGQSGAIPIGN